MIKEYGKKKVVTTEDKYEGIIVELNEGYLIAREYYRNEYYKYVPNDEPYTLDLMRVQKMNTEISKVREISRQLGTGHYVISENAILLISQVN